MKIFMLYNATALFPTGITVYCYNNLKRNVYDLATERVIGVLVIKADISLPVKTDDFDDGLFSWVEPESSYYDALQDEWLHLLYESPLREIYQTIDNHYVALCAVEYKDFDMNLATHLEKYFAFKMAIAEYLPKEIEEKLKNRGWLISKTFF